MSNFVAKFDAELNVSSGKFLSSIKKIESQKIVLSNFTLDTKGLSGKIQQALNGHKFTLNLGNVKIDNLSKQITGSVGSIGEKASTQFSQSFVNGIKAKLNNGSLDAAISSARTKMDKLNLSVSKIGSGAKATELQGQLKGLEAEFTKLTTLQQKMGTVGLSNKQLVGYYNEFNQTLKRVGNTLTIVSNQAGQFASAFQVASLQTRMESFLTKNTRATKVYGDEVRNYISTLKNLSAQGNVSAADLQRISIAFKQVEMSAKSAGLTGNTFASTFQKAINSISKYVGASMLIYTSIRAIKSGINSVVELDTALVDLQKTTDGTASQLKNFYFNSNEIAKSLGVTTKEVIQAAADWSRLGYSIKDAETMAKVSSIFSSISPGMGIEKATDGLVSAMKAFKIEADDALDGIASKINAIGNSQAVSNIDIVEILTRSSAAMAEANNSLEETIALGTAATEITRNAESVGTALKTVSLRIRGYDEETEEYIGGIEELSGAIADLTKTAEHPMGVSLFRDEAKTEYKSTYEIFRDISKIYDELTDKQQAGLLEKLGGKRQAQVNAAILNNFEAVEKSLKTMTESSGSAMREMGIIEESLEYKLNSLKQTAVGVAQNLFQRDSLGVAVQGLTKFLELIELITSKLGLLGSVVVGAGIFNFVKNLDQLKSAGKIVQVLGTIGKGSKDVDAVTRSLNGLTAAEAVAVVQASDLSGAETAKALAMKGVDAQTIASTLAMKGLNAEDIKQILIDEGICSAEEAQAIATGAVADAEVFATTKTVGLSTALKGLWATMAAHPIFLVIAALTALVAIGSAVKRSAEDRKQAAFDAADNASKEAESIRELYHTYEEANNAYKNHTGSKEDLQSATDELLAALGYEGVAIENLQEKYESLDDTIRRLTNEALQKKIADMASGYNEAAEELLNGISGGLFFHGSTKFTDALKKAGFNLEDITNPYANNKQKEELYFNFGGVGTIEDAMAAVDTLTKMREALVKEFGVEGVKESKEMQMIDGYISSITESYDKVAGYIEDINKAYAEIDYNNYISANGIPKTIEEYEKLKETLISSAQTQENTYLGSTENIESAITSLLSSAPELQSIAKSAGDVATEVGLSFKDILADETFSESIDSYVEKVGKLQEALSKMNSGEFEKSDLYELIKEFPDLADSTDDLDTAINNLLGDMNNKVVEQFNEQFGKIDQDSEEDVKALKNFMDTVLELGKVVGSTKFAININAEANGMQNLFNAMKESVSSTGLTVESIKNLKERYQDLEGYDASRLFERTTNGIHLNTKALRELEHEYEQQKKTDLKNTLDDLVNEYNDLTESINNETNAAKRAEMYEQRSSLLEDINSVAELAAQYDGLTSAFYKWEQAQSIGEEGDMYDSLAGGLKNIKELYDQGLVGTNKFRTAVQLMTFDDLETADVDTLTEAYETALPKIERYFTEGQEGVKNFLTDVQNLNSEWAHMNSDGSWEINFGVGTDEDVAKELGINVEAVQSILRKLSDYGFDVNLDSIYSSIETLDTLREKAEKANKTLKDLGKTNVDFNFDTTTVSDAWAEIDKARATLEQFKDEDGHVNLELEGAQEALTALTQLVLHKQELDTPAVMSVDTSTFENCDADVKRAIELMQEFVTIQNEIQLEKNIDINADTSDLENDLAGIQTQMQEINPDILAELNLNPESIPSIESSIDALTSEEINLVIMDNSDTVLKHIKDINNEPLNEKTLAIQLGNYYSVWSALDRLNEKTLSPKYIDVYTREHGKNGVNGTAYASGTWGTSHSGTALVGELGRELLVRDGKWYTIGDAGAEFIKYRKGDIVFNHLQTEELFANGRVTRGGGRASAFASGTAFSNATGKFKQEETVVQGNGDVQTTPSNDPNTKSDTDPKDKTAIEKFKEWFSKLFDWIEVKLERQTDKISKYVKKAETALDDKRYKSSAKNYYSAIKETGVLADWERKGAAKYKDKANDVMNKAVSNGVLKADEAKHIKEAVKNGKLKISEYSEEVQEVIKDYQEWYNKMKECNDSLPELHDNVRDYVKSLKDLRDAQRDASLSSIDYKLDIATGGITTDSSTALSNSQLNYSNSQLKSKNKIYNTAVTNSNKDVSKLRGSANYSVKKELKSVKKDQKKYKKALKNAQSAMKAKRAVSNSDLNEIRRHSIQTYERIYAYNNALENLEAAKMERATEYAANSAEIYKNIAEIYDNRDKVSESNINLNKQKADLAQGSKNKNEYLRLAAKQYDTIKKNDRAEINRYDSDIKSAQKTIAKANKKQFGAQYSGASGKTKTAVSKTIDEAQKYAKSGKPIPASVIAKLATYNGKGLVSNAFYNSCIDYNNALQSQEEAKAQYELDKLTAKAEKAAIGTQMVSNIEQDYKNKLDQNKVATTKLETSHKLKTTKGIALKSSDYKKLIEQSAIDESLYEDAADAIQKQIEANLKNGYWTKGSQEYKDAIQTYEDYKNKAKECAIQQEEWNNTIINLPFEKIEKAIDLLDAIADRNESQRKLRKSQGKDLTEKSYLKQIEDNNKKIAKYQEERVKAYENYLKAMADDNKVYGGKTSDEWKQMYLGFDTTINNLKADIESIKDELRGDVYWRTFERAHEKCERLKKTLEGISNLIDESMFYNDNGSFTDYGVSQVANLVKQYENARKEVSNYSADIANLNQLYADGWYTQNEYKEKLAELQSSLLDAASDVKSVTDSIIDMYKNMAQSELDALFELIDARSEALKKKKEYYDYDKTLRDQSKDVLSLRAQIAALEGVVGAEAKAKRAQLQAQLKEAEDTLNETVNNHIMELSSTSLDDLKDVLQDEFDEKWEKIGSDLDSIKELLAAANTLTESSSKATYSTLTALLDFYGIDAQATKIDKKFASGTNGVSRKLRALIGEDGQEIATTSNGLILTLNRGDGVIPADMTRNLLAMARGTFSIPNSALSSINGLSGTTINQHYDSLITIEGSADAATVEDLKKFSKDILEQSYNYTSQKIYNGYIKAGGKRVV